MSKRTDSANTPRYVLRNGNQAIYPSIRFDNPDTDCVCVYGFSGKAIYDKFIKSTEQALTPYPLVAGYLLNQIDDTCSDEAPGDRPRLVILDATDQAQPVLLVATMATVLLAQQEGVKQVSVEYELVFDPETTGYRFKDDSTIELPIDPLCIVK